VLPIATVLGWTAWFTISLVVVLSRPNPAYSISLLSASCLLLLPMPESSASIAAGFVVRFEAVPRQKRGDIELWCAGSSAIIGSIRL
jgi:hypothetical protein